MFTTVTKNWRNEMDNHSSMSADDGTIFWTELTDPTLGGTDNVNDNIDSSDIAFLGTHGSGTTTGCPNACVYTEGNLQLTTTSGDPQGDCTGKVTSMRLGNSQAEYFDNFACNSLELRNNGFYNTAAAGLHQYHGYSGTTANGSGTEDFVDNYIRDAFNSSAAWAWVIQMTDYNHWGGTSDACAVSKIWGTSDADADYRGENERYGSGSYSDADTTFSYVYFLSDCDPPSPIPGAMGTW
jgi:acyl-CoA synthetase (AMP-forming)/AMP-acid ligase II